MKKFTYVHVSSKAEALKVLNREKEKSCLVAGATNVLPLIRAEKMRDKTLINIRQVHQLRYINETDQALVIGALTTIADLEKSGLVLKYAPALGEAAQNFADPTTRNSATIGGNLANASPAADTATPLLSLNATVVAESAAQGERKIPLEDFFQGVNRTVLDSAELITAVEIPKTAANSAGTFIKLGLRNAMAISLVSVAAALQLEQGRIKEARLALGSVAPTPVRARKAEEFLLGKEISPELAEEAARIAEEEISPIDDVRASAQYRKTVARVMIKRALAKCAKMSVREDELSTGQGG